MKMKAGNVSISSEIESRREENGSMPDVFATMIDERVSGNEEHGSFSEEKCSVPHENDPATEEKGEEQREKEQEQQEIVRVNEEIEKETEEDDTETEENDKESEENDQHPTGGSPLTATKNTTHRTLATLKLPKQVGALVTYVHNIVTRMTGNANFTTPVPSLPAVTTACNELQDAETAALARTKGAVAIRNEKRTALVALLQQLRGYVQSIADGNVENGTSIIESAGIAVRKPVVRKPRVFSAVPGAVSGTAKLVAASAGPRSSYQWEYSTDGGGKTWVTQPVTIQAKTTVSGLAPGASVQFRYKPVTPKGGEGDWSQPVNLIIR